MTRIPRKCVYCDEVYWWDIDNRYHDHECLTDKEVLATVLRDLDYVPAPIQEKKPKEKKKPNQFTCKKCNTIFESNSPHRVYCSPNCHRDDQIKMANERWLKRDINKVKKQRVPGYKVNEILEKKRVYYSDKLMKKFKAVRG
jgi:hypothetical protein